MMTVTTGAVGRVRDRVARSGTARPPATPVRRHVWRRSVTRSSRALALATALALALAACGPTGEPRIEVGRAQASVPIAGASQVVVDIHNRGDGDDRLIGAETDAALDTELHLTEIADSRATMATIAEVDVPAGERVRFRPGGLHLMLVLPDETVVAGGTFDLHLRFERSDDVVVPVEVVDLLDLVESSDGDG